MFVINKELKESIIKRLLLVGAVLCALFMLKGINASAYTTRTDTDGSVTGIVNQTYYDVSSWSDMYSAYRRSNQSTVFLNVVNDFSPYGSTSNGAQVQDGKNLTILGNNKTLYFGYPNSPTHLDYNAPIFMTKGFYSNYNSSLFSANATLRLENATWVNSTSFGIFEISNNASSTTQYHNVTEYNGSSNDAATPIINRNGRVEFSGNNVFNVTGSAQNFGPGKQNPNSLGSPITPSGGLFQTGQANWIQGANNVSILDGSTTLNMNGTQSDPFYHQQSDGYNASLNIADNAKMYWNIDNANAVADGAISSRTWTLGNGSEFDINGTSNTAQSQWFSGNEKPLNINTGNKSVFSAVTAGSLNPPDPGYDSSSGISVGSGATFLLSKVAQDSSNYAISGTLANGISLSDSSHLLVRSMSGLLFQNPWTISMPSSGLGGKFSKNYDGSSAKTEGSNTGSMTVNDTSQGDSFDLSGLNPGYSTDAANILNSNPDYFELWDAPTVLSFKGLQLNRTYSLTSSELPHASNAKTDLISGDDGMGFQIDSNNPNPAVHVMLQMTGNNQKNIISYFWKDTSGSVGDELTEGNSQQIWSSKGKTTKSTDAGNSYICNYDKDHGLMIKTTNALKAGNYVGATFDYTMISGPGD
ncbi:hypothetical protein [Fructobacillus durionis]|uniref:Cell surface protein n=1 Tax=Fructobacillus durionis TaxID=283737 RepID=A0A1I1GSN9_9LACO|nr:hypothetical protein [Fructobacillus durionis]SFC14312.1 hypothetical protein SAMN05660453_1164 [Fructobacillus durionis]